MVTLQMLILLTYVNKSKYHFQKPTINHRKSPLAMAQKFISTWITFSIAEVAQKCNCKLQYEMQHFLNN
jgi:hypothetical protein